MISATLPEGSSYNVPRSRLTGDVQEVKSSFKQFVSLGIKNVIQFTG